MASAKMIMKRPDAKRVLSSIRALGPGVVFPALAVFLLVHFMSCSSTPKTRFFISYFTGPDMSVAFGNHPRAVEILDAARSKSGE